MKLDDSILSKIEVLIYSSICWLIKFFICFVFNKLFILCLKFIHLKNIPLYSVNSNAIIRTVWLVRYDSYEAYIGLEMPELDSRKGVLAEYNRS